MVAVHLGDFSSTLAPLVCGVPQGSILGPLLFSLYMLPLDTIFQKYSISYHFYANDLHFYVLVSLDESCSLDKVHERYTDFKLWLYNNFLHLNESKSEVLIVGSPLSPTFAGQLASLSSKLDDHVKSLGVILDSLLNVNKQISAAMKGSLIWDQLLKLRIFFWINCLLYVILNVDFNYVFVFIVKHFKQGLLFINVL